MHGGADGSGAPKGERTGNCKHGRYTKEVAATRQWLQRGHSFAPGAEQAPLTSPTRAILPHLHRDHLFGVVDGLTLLDRVGQLLHFGQKLLPFQ